VATNIPFGAPQAIILQSVALFAANMQRNTTLNRLTGKMPQQADAEGTIRRQSSNEMPIVRCMDLTKMAGDSINFNLINPMGGIPVMGGQMAEGHGRAMSFSQDKLEINQARYPISAGDTMTQQRTPIELRRLARALGQSYMDRLSDQLILVHMAGARGFHDNIEWAVPVASHPKFADILVNPVRAPSKNRHFMSTGSGIEYVTASANEISLSSTDLMNADVVDGIRTFIDSMALPPPPVIFEGDKMANDSPIRVLLVSSEQYTAFVQSTGFRTLQANAMARSQVAANNPLFQGDAGLWNGILIVKMPKPIRFFAGDPINHCASFTSATETTTDLVPAAFGTTYAVDRAILLGGQALAEAWGKHRMTGNPYFWSEKMLDHDDKLEVVVGAINGRSKVRFQIDHGALGQQITDYGVMAIDTVVKLGPGQTAG
jgi:N4-gp56 family major capsid protein